MIVYYYHNAIIGYQLFIRNYFRDPGGERVMSGLWYSSLLYSIHQHDMQYLIKHVEMPGIEPGASYMQSMRSTTELHPLPLS